MRALSSCRLTSGSKIDKTHTFFYSTDTTHLSSIGKSPVPKQAMMSSFEMLSAQSEEILNLTEDSKES